MNKAVSTICAKRRSWSGVNAESGKLGNAKISSVEVSDKDAIWWDCDGLICRASNAPPTLGRRSDKNRSSVSIDRVAASENMVLSQWKIYSIDTDVPLGFLVGLRLPAF